MGYVFSSPAGLITLFALGIEAVIGFVLALSQGLSALQKDLLVGFAIGFPTVVLLILLLLLARARQASGDDALTLPE